MKPVEGEDSPGSSYVKGTAHAFTIQCGTVEGPKGEGVVSHKGQEYWTRTLGALREPEVPRELQRERAPGTLRGPHSRNQVSDVSHKHGRVSPGHFEPQSAVVAQEMQ